MAHNAGAPESLRPDPDAHRTDGRFEHDDDLRKSGNGHMVYSEPDSFGLHADMGAWDRVAMAVKRAVGRVKNSSATERIIVGLLAAFVAMMTYVAVRVNDLHGDVFALSREVGVGIERVNSHIGNHPNTAIESDVDELQRRLRDHEIGHPR